MISAERTESSFQSAIGFSKKFFGQIAVDFDKSAINGTIPERFAYIVAHYPNAIAIRDNTDEITYAELDRRSNRVAHAILDRAGTVSEPVAILLEHGPAPLIAILGVLKAGKFYFALDPSHPRAHVKRFLNDAGARLLITNSAHQDIARACRPEEMRTLDLDGIDGAYPSSAIDLPFSSDLPAVIFYTSGTTGRPKGVYRNHLSILYSVWNYTHYFGITREDRHSFLFFSGFGASVPDIYNTLLNGATVCPYTTHKSGLGGFADWLTRERISILQAPVTFLREFLNHASGRPAFPDLRVAIVVGQSIFKRDVQRFQSYFPAHSSLVNVYGMTETAIITAFPIDTQTVLNDDKVPAGYPLPEKEVLILDAHKQPVKQGGVGEIAVRSRYMTLGYWQNPELTRQKYIFDHEAAGCTLILTGDLGRLQPDGCLEHLGRKDLQVKIRGYQIEPTQIEAVLLTFECIREVAVTVREVPSQEPRLIAYWVPATQDYPDNWALRQWVAERLPTYMIPSQFVMLAEMPYTSSRKVDRQRLPDPGSGRASLSTPLIAGRDAIERRLTAIWEKIFEFSPIGVEDNFFDLGGDSIRGLRLAYMIESCFKKPFTTVTLWQAPTIAEQAVLVKNDDPGTSAGLLVPIRRGMQRPPLFFVPPAASTLYAAYALSKCLGPAYPMYGLQYKGMETDTTPHGRVETMAAAYIREIRRVRGRGPYFLMGMCFGGIVAFEMAQQLVREGQEVALLLILDTLLPPGYHRDRKVSAINATVRQGRTLAHRMKYQLRFFQKRAGEYWAEDPKLLAQAICKTLLGSSRRYTREPIDYVSKKARILKMPAHERRVKRVQQTHDRARMTYVPHVYPGKISLLRSERMAPTWEIRSAWRDLSREPLDLLTVPCTHWELLKAPHIGEVAGHVRTFLRRAHAEMRTA